MRSPLMDELSDLDPARHLRAPGTPQDEALHEILGADRAVPVRRHRPAGVWAGAAAVAAVAVAVGVTWASTFGAPSAYATWTAVPTAPAPAERATAQELCPTAVPRIVSGADGSAAPELVPTAPVLTEVRGDYTYVLQAGDGAVGDCFVSAADGDPVVYTSGEADGTVPDPGPGDVVTMQSGVASWSQTDAGEGAVTSAYGRAGEDVVALTVTLDSGERVEATVDDGWWMVWAPGEDAFTGPAEVTLDDGTTEQAALTVG
ncbi:hypothetical protein ACNHYB_10565 [Isoptericola jiangsuensis]|uniref:hypothetical protein n=1 Tax=Isoptericola jiangsuensis TaxID=548579 RepID=UPI003AAB9A81